VDNRHAREFRNQQRYLAEAPARRLGELIFLAVLLLQALVVLTLAVAIWLTLLLIRLDQVIGLYTGCVLLLQVVLLQVITIAFYRRKKWAWTAALVVFILSLPGLLGIFGLMTLIRPGVREAFQTAPGTKGVHSIDNDVPRGEVAELPAQ
jgi:hypothetical protein